MGIGRSDSQMYNVDYRAERYSTLFLLAGELPHSLGCVCTDTEYLFSIPFWNIVILNVAWKETSIVLCFGIMLLGVNTFLGFWMQPQTCFNVTLTLYLFCQKMKIQDRVGKCTLALHVPGVGTCIIANVVQVFLSF